MNCENNNKSKNEQTTFKDDILQEIPTEMIPNLLELLKQDWPYSVFVCNIIQNYCKWHKKNAAIEFYILCPNGYMETGTVVCITPNYGGRIALYTMETNGEILKASLKTTSRIDWSLPILFTGIHQKHFEALQEVIQFKGVSSQANPCENYVMSPEKARNLDFICPPNLHFGALDESHGPTVVKYWPHAREDAIHYVNDAINYNHCIGLFTTDLQLVAWVLDVDYGIGILHTLEEHRRKGYGQVLMKAIMKHMAENDKYIHLHVVHGNVASSRLVQSIGCIEIGGSNWIVLNEHLYK